MDKLITYFKKHGYAQMKDLKKASFQTRNISKLLNQGLIYKIKPGFYRINELKKNIDVKEAFLDICNAIPEGVLFLMSALDFHNLTTFNPSKVYLAIPHQKKPPRIFYPPVKLFYLYENFYKTGIEVIKTGYGTIRVYDIEKTICDIFRYRNKLGEDLAIEALKNYLALNKTNIDKIIKYAELTRINQDLMPYLKAYTEYRWE
jgi:predicted transcriptional regulator of viral defense system